MNLNYSSQTMYLFLRNVVYFGILIFVVFATNLSKEMSQFVAYALGLVVLVLDLVLHLKNRWNAMALLTASMLSLFFLNFKDPFLTVTQAMVFTTFFSPYLSVFFNTKQEEKIAAA